MITKSPLSIPRVFLAATFGFMFLIAGCSCGGNGSGTAAKTDSTKMTSDTSSRIQTPRQDTIGKDTGGRDITNPVKKP